MVDDREIKREVINMLAGYDTHYDVDDIVRELVDTYKLIGDAPEVTFDEIDRDDFWVIVARHDLGEGPRG